MLLDGARVTKKSRNSTDSFGRQIPECGRVELTLVFIEAARHRAIVIISITLTNKVSTGHRMYMQVSFHACMTFSLSSDAPVWLQSAFDDVLARSSSFVVNVPIAPPPSPVYAINMRRWLRTGLWAEWVSVLNMTMDQEAAQRVKTSSNDGGRKYIPVRIGPLQYETYYQVTVQYRRGSTQSPTSAVRTTRTLAGG